MFKKLASILFKEEEIIIEEELEKHEDELKIPELKPMVASKPVAEPAIATKYEPKSQPLSEEKIVFVESKDDRKPMMINVDEDPVVKETKVRREAKPEPKNTYRPQAIISPIFGGPEGEEPMKPAPTQTYGDAKRRAPLTQVISPMFGRVEEEAHHEVALNDASMDLDITEMLSPERTGEEVQVSLYDYLEGLEDE
ncbi:hypothetical protein G7062_08500 [Erysipelothrix sp. HDW6C]|uniref:hypothetical protein n=1 Tax=Erysipelothrix sp. HDW6C TaxID=2714930 RepID=UPI001409C0DE|nr:hypothetical protein [Erysipelothrix sp. HDW6C]QIK70332.1 hypothetical protein G7062_08500 [Erysipelothrix sp. HDW6C]